MAKPPAKRTLKDLFAPRDATETSRPPQSPQRVQLDPPTVITQDGRERYALPYPQERQFNDWYKEVAAKSGIDQNPDSPLHKYDYRGAWLAGESPQVIAEDNLPHWPSEFKDADHPNRFVDGRDTSHEGRDLRDKASRIQALMQRMERAAPPSPRDATRVKR